MKRFTVIWTHVRGGSNTEYVSALSTELAKQFIENRHGYNNISRIVVKPFV